MLILMAYEHERALIAICPTTLISLGLYLHLINYHKENNRLIKFYSYFAKKKAEK